MPTSAASLACSGLKASAKALSGYNSVMDNIVPWNSMEGHVNALTQYRNDYSRLAADLIGDITTSIRNGRVEYCNATRAVYEWCKLVVPLLNALLRLLKGPYDESVKSQKKIVLKVLDEGSKQLDAAKDSLHSSSSFLNEAAGKLIKLQTQLTNDANNDSAYFRTHIERIRAAYKKNLVENLIAGPIGLLVSLAEVAEGEMAIVPKLKRHLLEISSRHGELGRRTNLMKAQINTACQQIETDKHTISEMSAKTEEAKLWFGDDMDDLADELISASKELIDLCSDYTKLHS